MITGKNSAGPSRGLIFNPVERIHKKSKKRKNEAIEIAKN